MKDKRVTPKPMTRRRWPKLNVATSDSVQPGIETKGGSLAAVEVT